MILKIIHTSDLHGYFFPTDYLDREEKNTGYLSILNNIAKVMATRLGLLVWLQIG